MSFPVVLDEFVCCAVCLRGRERSCSPFVSVTVSNSLLPSTGPLHSKKGRLNKSVCVCVRVCALERGEATKGQSACVPHVVMRRAFSIFRGYRRASEDDDEVFVCSSGRKVTTADRHLK